MKWGKHIIKSWSTTQSIIALSSGEAEYYAMVKTGSQLLGLRALIGDMGIDLHNSGIKCKIITDASAAKSISQRIGLGKVRHIEVNTLWLQDKVREGEIMVEKVGGKINIADALTKYPWGGESEIPYRGNPNEGKDR